MSRESIKSLIFDIAKPINSWKLLPQATIDTYVRRIERSCWNASIARALSQGINRSLDDQKFAEIYSEYCSKITMHLDPTSSINVNTTTPMYFGDLIAADKVDLNTISDLPSVTMQPEPNEKIRKYIEARKDASYERKRSSQFTCSKCKGKDTTYFEAQLRSADEPATKFITCESEECGHSWKLTI